MTTNLASVDNANITISRREFMILRILMENIDRIQSKDSLENPTKKNGVAIVNIAKGGLATSGDANRFLLKNGKRYSHILNPLTGYPIKNAARSITVASDNCVQAGLLATLAILQGENAESFLDSEGVTYWCYR